MLKRSEHADFITNLQRVPLPIWTVFADSFNSWFYSLACVPASYQGNFQCDDDIIKSREWHHQQSILKKKKNTRKRKVFRGDFETLPVIFCARGKNFAPRLMLTSIWGWPTLETMKITLKNRPSLFQNSAVLACLMLDFQYIVIEVPASFLFRA